MNKYEVIIYWSEEDRAFIAEVPELPGCAAHAPPIRRMLELGIPVGAGTDATRVASYNPWVALHWLVTGRTVGGASGQFGNLGNKGPVFRAPVNDYLVFIHSVPPRLYLRITART